MTDLSTTIAPKSDQLNADDLIPGPRTVTVTKVSYASAEQPIAINFDGDDGKPYKPCKSMRRVLVQVWGKDGNDYVGRSMTLYRDKDVIFGGQPVGGIRISHMSHIDKPMTMALTATRAARKPFTVKPLKVETARPDQPAQKPGKPDRWAELQAEVDACNSAADLEAIQGRESIQAALAQTGSPVAARLNAIFKAALDRFEDAPAEEESDFPGDWPSAEQSAGKAA